MDDTDSKIAEIEARREARRTGIEKARAEQYAKDLEQVDTLEAAEGDDRLSVLKTPSFVAGLPTVVVVRTPGSAVFNRFRSMVRKGGDNLEKIGAAKDLLAASCVAYPDEATYTKMKEEWPSIHDNAGAEAIKLGEAKGKA